MVFTEKFRRYDTWRDAVAKVREQFEVDTNYKILGEEISFTDGNQLRR